MEKHSAQDRYKTRQFWTNFFLDPGIYEGLLVSADCFFDKVLKEDTGEGIAAWGHQCDVREMHPFASSFPYQSSHGLTDENRYCPLLVTEHDLYLSDRFHALLPQIVEHYKQSFIDQIRCIHFLGMAGNEAVMLYPSQTRRLMTEHVARIAGEIRNIPAGFGDFRFNAPGARNLPVLLAAYNRKISELVADVDESSIYNLVSFAQYYFALLHPFYERCGRTSEDLMYLLFEQAGANKRYISSTGNRCSTLAQERMEMINQTTETFNQKIALYFGLESEKIRKTPDIYRELTATYFPDQFSRLYTPENTRPFYYHHPIPGLLSAYYFLMEALLFDEICSFTLDSPPAPVIRLGNHLREKGKSGYAYQSHWSWADLRLADVLDSLLGKPMQPQSGH